MCPMLVVQTIISVSLRTLEYVSFGLDSVCIRHALFYILLSPASEKMYVHAHAVRVVRTLLETLPFVVVTPKAVSTHLRLPTLYALDASPAELDVLWSGQHSIGGTVGGD